MSDAVRRGEIAAAREWMLRNGYMIVERERPFSCADAFYWSFAIVFAMFITGLATKAFEPEAPPIPGNLILALVGVSLVALVFPGHYLLKALVCRFRDRPNSVLHVAVTLLVLNVVSANLHAPDFGGVVEFLNIAVLFCITAVVTYMSTFVVAQYYLGSDSAIARAIILWAEVTSYAVAMLLQTQKQVNLPFMLFTLLAVAAVYDTRRQHAVTE